MQKTVGKIAAFHNGTIVSSFDDVETKKIICDNETNFKAGRAITHVAGREFAGVAGGTGAFAGIIDRAALIHDEFLTHSTGYLNQEFTVYRSGFKAHIQMFDAATGLVADTAVAVGYKVGFRQADGKFFAVQVGDAAPANTTIIQDENEQASAFVQVASDENGYATVWFKH